MSQASPSRTSPTLLGRLRLAPTDQEAWGLFVDRYATKIYAWCRQWHLQEADIEDVTQCVLVKLALRLRNFSYDPGRSFRGWLKTLTHHALCDFLEQRKEGDLGSGDSRVLESLKSVEMREDLANRLEQEYDRELLEEAIARVRLRVAPHRFEAFRLLAIENLRGTEVAERLGMPVATAYTERSKVQALLKEEIQKLEGMLDRQNEEHS